MCVGHEGVIEIKRFLSFFLISKGENHKISPNLLKIKACAFLTQYKKREKRIFIDMTDHDQPQSEFFLCNVSMGKCSPNMSRYIDFSDPRVAMSMEECQAKCAPSWSTMPATLHGRAYTQEINPKNFPVANPQDSVNLQRFGHGQE